MLCDFVADGAGVLYNGIVIRGCSLDYDGKSDALQRHWYHWRARSCCELRARPRRLDRAAKMSEAAIVGGVRDVISKSIKTGKLVGGWESISAMLLDGKLAYYQTAEPDFIAPHPLNRSGDGVNPEKAHKLGLKIVTLGFSKKRASEATCFEAPVDASANASFHADANAIADLSNGMCPAWTAPPKFYSVGGSNTNMFWRAVAHEANTPQAALQDERGRIDKVRLMSDPEIKAVVEGGMRWLVLTDRCAQLLPDLADFIQNALNATAVEAQTEVESMSSGWRTAAAN